MGQSARLDIRLEVGDIEQTVEVSGTIPLLQTERLGWAGVVRTNSVRR